MDYTTSDVAQILGMTPAQVRRHAHGGYVNPRRGSRNRFLFSFQDLIILRVVTELVRDSVPTRRVRRSLQKLREQLPDGRPLTAVRLMAEGDEIVVHDGSASWEPDSGQYLLGFSVSDLARKVEPFARRAATSIRESDQTLSTEQLFDFALELEVVAVDEAITAYESLLADDEGHVDAHVNLGRLFHESGDLDRAERHYRRALDADPESAVANFNLGVVFEDRDDLEGAIAAYQKALEGDPNMTDALYNAAQIFERLGDRGSAITCLRRLKDLADGRRR